MKNFFSFFTIVLLALYSLPTHTADNARLLEEGHAQTYGTNDTSRFDYLLGKSDFYMLDETERATLKATYEQLPYRLKDIGAFNKWTRERLTEKNYTYFRQSRHPIHHQTYFSVCMALGAGIILNFISTYMYVVVANSDKS